MAAFDSSDNANESSTDSKEIKSVADNLNVNQSREHNTLRTTRLSKPVCVEKAKELVVEKRIAKDQIDDLKVFDKTSMILLSGIIFLRFV